MCIFLFGFLRQFQKICSSGPHFFFPLCLIKIKVQIFVFRFTQCEEIEVSSLTFWSQEQKCPPLSYQCCYQEDRKLPFLLLDRERSDLTHFFFWSYKHVRPCAEEDSAFAWLHFGSGLETQEAQCLNHQQHLSLSTSTHSKQKLYFCSTKLNCLKM